MPDPAPPPDPAHTSEVETGDDQGFTEDATAPKTVAGKLNEMGKDLRKLTRASLFALGVVAAVVVVVESFSGAAHPHSAGFGVGGILAILNLWILAGGYFALIDERAPFLRLMLAAGGSLALLLGASLYLLAAHRDWIVGFAFGLSSPALGGILYGLEKSREDA